MARKRVVSRTIKSTNCTVLCANVTEEKTYTDTFLITGKVKSKEEVLKKLKKMYETDEVKLIHITATEEQEQLYAMPEDEFLKYAKPVTKEETEE